MLTEQAKIIRIDYSTPFNPIAFGCGGGLKVRAEKLPLVRLPEIDTDKIELVEFTETLNGEERLEELKTYTNHVCLDARVLQVMLNNPELVPEAMKAGITKGSPYLKYFTFDGTVLIDSNKELSVLVSFNLTGDMHWFRNSLNKEFKPKRMFAVMYPV